MRLDHGVLIGSMVTPIPAGAGAVDPVDFVRMVGGIENAGDILGIGAD